MVGEVPGGASPSPWRSRFYVTNRHSADGETYRPGDEIPYAEAKRQGLVDAPPTPKRGVPSTTLCSNCKGSGRYTWPPKKGHRRDCGCKFCGPCRRCAGRGRERVMMPATEGNA